MKPSIVFEDETVLSMSRDRAWDLITDPEVVVSCVPGASVVSIDDDGTINGTLSLRLGPSETQFAGKIIPTFDEENYSGSLRGQGTDGKGRTRSQIITQFGLSERGPDEAVFSVHSEIAVSGALAQFASAGGQAVARTLLTDFAKNIGALGAPPAEAATTLPAAKESQGTSLSVFSLVLRSIKDAIARLFNRSKKPPTG